MNSTWSACACATTSRYHVATGGSAKHAGFAGTPGGALYACYRIGDALAVAYQFDPTPPNNWDVQFAADADADDCDLAAGFGEQIHLVYGVGALADGPRDLVYRGLLDNALGDPVHPGAPGDADDGREPKVAVAKSGAAFILAGGRLAGGQHVLRAFEQTGLATWTDGVVAVLPTPSDDQALALCDDGVPLALYASGVGSARWTARVAARTGGAWDTALLDDSSQLVGIGAALTCAGGAAYGVFQDFYNARLVEAWSDTPATLASWQTAPVPTGADPILWFDDLRVHGDTLWVAAGTETGDVLLGARPTDGATPWRFHRLAISDAGGGGALTGDVRLWLDPLGRPHVLYFGAHDGGPWIATLE